MAINQDNNELSMAEILASIRSILQESGAADASKTATIKPQLKEEVEEVFDLSPAMIVSAPKPVQPNAIPAAPASAVRPVAETQMFKTINLETPVLPEKDVSSEIISSFTRLFEENDFRRRTEQPMFDADALLQQIIERAVAAKLDNHMLQNMVKESIVPVLEEWLSHYLPKLVAEEVERVMVKTGRR